MSKWAGAMRINKCYCGLKRRVNHCAKYVILKWAEDLEKDPALWAFPKNFLKAGFELKIKYKYGKPKVYPQKLNLLFCSEKHTIMQDCMPLF